jgi:hypothetical protein
MWNWRTAGWRLRTLLGGGLSNRTVFCSRKHNFIYVNIPKTGCSTIKQSLWVHEQGLSEDDPRVAQLKRKLHRQAREPFLKPWNFSYAEWTAFKEQAFTFTCVRHPQVRLLSAFLDKVEREGQRRLRYRQPILNALGETTPDADRKISWQEFVNSLTRTRPERMNPHWRPQYLHTMVDSLDFDFIARTERLDEDLNYLLVKIYGEGARKLPDRMRHATGSSEKLAAYYTKEICDIVTKVYERDFVTFGYEPIYPGSSAAAPPTAAGTPVPQDRTAAGAAA